MGVDCVLRLTLSQRHIEDLGDPCESVAWLNVEARPRQDDSLEEVIPPSAPITTSPHVLDH